MASSTNLDVSSPQENVTMSDKTDSIFVTDVKLTSLGDYQELSAIVDGEKLWFRFPVELDLEPRAEAFLSPALFEAMTRGAPLIIERDTPISSKIEAALPTIQSIFHCWNRDLQVIHVDAERRSAQTRIDGAICCFSGGVDSTYSFAQHREEISHLLLVQGFDNWKSKDDWRENVSARLALADAIGVKLIVVESNVRDFVEKRKIYWGLVLGGVLGGLGATIAPKRCFIPSSWTYQDLHAYGSHPLVDPLWSTEATEVTHDGADTTRSHKIESIACSQLLLDQLQVCWNSSSRNCGDCPKCVRTAIVLHLIGKRSQNLPSISIPQQLKLLRIDGEASLPYIIDLIDYSKEKGALDLHHRFIRMRNRYIMKNALDQFLKALLGDWVRKIDRRLSPKEWYTYRGGLRSSKLNL